MKIIFQPYTFRYMRNLHEYLAIFKRIFLVCVELLKQ